MAKRPAKKATRGKRAAASSKMEITNDSALAKRYGVNTKTVWTWRQAGLPCKRAGKGYVYVIADTDRWVDVYRQKSTRDEMTPAARVRLAIDAEKLRQDRLRTGAMNRKAQTARGTLLSRGEYELFAIEAIQLCRDRFLRIPREMCKHVPSRLHRGLIEGGYEDATKILRALAADSAGPAEARAPAVSHEAAADEPQSDFPSIVDGRARPLPAAARTRFARAQERLRQERLKTVEMEADSKAARDDAYSREAWLADRTNLVRSAREFLSRLPKLLCKRLPKDCHRIVTDEATTAATRACDELFRFLEQGPKE